MCLVVDIQTLGFVVRFFGVATRGDGLAVENLGQGLGPKPETLNPYTLNSSFHFPFQYPNKPLTPKPLNRKPDCSEPGGAGYCTEWYYRVH